MLTEPVSKPSTESLTNTNEVGHQPVEDKRKEDASNRDIDTK